MVHIIFLLVIICSIPILNKKEPFYIMSFMILTFFLSIRYNYGNDYQAYRGIFIGINQGYEVWGSSDIGFRYLNLILPNFEILIIIQSIFYMYTIYKLITENLYRDYYWLSITLLLINPYLFLIHLSSIRQTFAICFFILAIIQKNKNKNINATMLTLIGTTFHSSAIILLPIVVLINDRRENFLWTVLTPIITIILTITPLFEKIMIIITPILPTNYLNYIDSDLKNSLRTLILSSIIYLIIVFYYKLLDEKEIIYGKLAIISSSLSLITFKISMISRFQLYFDVFIIIIIPIIVSRQKNKLLKYLLLSVIMGIYGMRYISFFQTPLWIESYRIYKTIMMKY